MGHGVLLHHHNYLVHNDHQHVHNIPQDLGGTWWQTPWPCTPTSRAGRRSQRQQRKPWEGKCLSIFYQLPLSPPTLFFISVSINTTKWMITLGLCLLNQSSLGICISRETLPPTLFSSSWLVELIVVASSLALGGKIAECQPFFRDHMMTTMEVMVVNICLPMVHPHDDVLHALVAINRKGRVTLYIFVSVFSALTWLRLKQPVVQTNPRTTSNWTSTTVNNLTKMKRPTCPTKTRLHVASNPIPTTWSFETNPSTKTFLTVEQTAVQTWWWCF